MQNTELAGYLTKNKFFAGLDPDQILKLDAGLFEVVHYKAGHVLIEQGSFAHEMYLIAAGTVQITKRLAGQQEMDIIQRTANDFIGELALIEDEPRSTNAYCRTDAVIIIIKRENFFSIMEQLPPITLNLTRTIANRQRESDTRTGAEVVRYKILLNLNEQILSQKTELERLNQELAAKNEALYRAATTDRLTGIFNRSYLMEVLLREFINSQRYRNPLVCILLDIDHFKSFNDTHGHIIGDFVLKETAQRIGNCVREGDVLARYGGEEFVVVLPNTTLSSGVAVAEKIRADVESATYNYQDLQLKVTISLGVTDINLGAPQSEDKMLQYADEALYAAKRGGRNRVVSYMELLSSV